jgi:hypothetical protein
MIYKIQSSLQQTFPIIIGVCLLAVLICSYPASALTPLPTPEPKPGSFGLEATKTQPPPTQAATITTPGSGASFSSSPITVNGICPNGLLVQVYNNGVMVGAVMCTNGSFSVEVSLFAGTNELSAIVYDELDQAGPVSNSVTVTYTDTNLTAFGALITLTSSYGRRSSAAGTQLGWPLQLSGGTGPYAFSIDWGDGSPTELKSQSIAGVVAIAHTYKKAGIYQTNVKVTDVNGVSAFLQVIALASGKVDTSLTPEKPSDTGVKPQILWAPTAVSLLLLVPSFWLGRLSQLTTLRNKMLKERDAYKEK